MKLIRKAAALVLLAGIITSTGFADKLKEIFSPEQEETEPECEDITPKRGKYAPRETESEAQSTFSDAVTVMNESSGWYCQHMKDGTRPPIPSEMSYITEHGGYYIGEDEKVIYLTFDAGYENGNVEKILNTLKQENVPGAFFILDNLAKTNTDLVKRMVDEGHTVCNHTAKHKDMTKMTSKEDFAAELRAMEDVYRDKIGGEIARYYRPPEGKFNEQNLAWADELGYKTIFWSFAYADWDNANQMSREKAVEKIITNTHNGEVILLHPTSKTNAEILPELIVKWREMGFTFGTLDELTGQKGEHDE